MNPRDFFPHMPDEVFSAWLQPFIDQIGWPFTQESTTALGTRWQFLFGGLELQELKQRRFFFDSIDQEALYAQFTPLTISIIDSIILSDKQRHAVALDIENTGVRFTACADYLRRYNTIPAPIIIDIQLTEAVVLDGYHRLAAIRHINPPKPFMIPAWFTKSEV